MDTYYPALISKLGEINALISLDQANKNETTPIIDLVMEGEGVTFDRIKKTIKTHWSFDGHEIIVDYSRFIDDSGLTKINDFFKDLKGINVIPIVSFASTDNQKKIAKDQIKRNGGICARISLRNGVPSNFNESLLKLINEFDVEIVKVILILDFGFIEAGNIQTVSALAVDTLNAIPHRNEWKSVVVLSGSFPENLAAFTASPKPHTRKRQEEVLYGAVAAKFKSVRYGDYGLKHPEYLPGAYAGTCSVKYSTKSAFIIYRGILAKKSPIGNRQYIKHCKNLINTNDYSGEHFSWGDGKIKKISKEKIKDEQAKTGNATTWVTISWTHHITLINTLASN